MAFVLVWQSVARESFDELMRGAQAGLKQPGAKSNKAMGLFKQAHKCILLLAENPRHPGLHTHEFYSLTNPYDRKAKLFEAYAQDRTPGAYRVFWCYGPGKDRITIIAITPHP